MSVTNRPLKVFLCHSSNDKPAVRELYQKLRTEAWIQPWLDEEELYPGQDWNMEIEKAIRETDAIIVCLSKNSITKEGYVQKEIKRALDYSDEKPDGTVFIIPVRLEDCKPPERLSKWQYADCFEGQRERGVQKLRVSLQKRADSLGLKFVLYAQKEEQRIEKEKNQGLDREAKKKTPQFVKSKESFAYQSGTSPTVRKNKFRFSSWQMRVLTGSTIGVMFILICLLINLIFDLHILLDWGIFFAMTLSGGVAGLLIHPSKPSLIFLGLGFFIFGLISMSYATDLSAAEKAGLFILVGANMGFPFGALASRILYYVDVV